MTTVNEVMQQWIKDANDGRIKIGTRELTHDELALIGDVLRCVAGDLAVASFSLDNSLRTARSSG